MKVPFNDLGLQHKLLKKEVEESFKKIIDTSSFVRGEEVFTFEKKFAEINNSKNCISCANGTDALYIAMRALNVKSGDEVIVPAHSWISTSETVTQAGGRVVFCDTRKDTFTIDFSDIKRKITDKTVGIIPVHLYGHPADMNEINIIAQENNLWVIEDCAQAHLATYRDQLIGTLGDIATFSFYPGKNLGAMGDAGAIITNNDELALKMQKIARHGGIRKGVHEIEGINSRMDTLQAAVLNIKLKHLEKWTENRRKIALTYKEQLKNNKKITLPYVEKDCNPVWHLYVIKHDERDNLAKNLNEVGIQTNINYPISLPFLEAYKYLKLSKYDMPNAFYNQSRILSIPIFPEMNDDQISYVAEMIHKYA